MPKKGETYKVEIVDMTNEGLGVGKADGFTLFIKDAVIGDECEVEVIKDKKTYGYARILKVIKPSPDRVEPRCKKAGPCGGCALQAMSYEAQLRFKKNKVKNNLIRIGGFEEEYIDEILGETIGMDEPWRYRNKAIIPVGTDKEGKLVYGFYARHSHNIIGCEDCLLQPEEFAIVMKKLSQDLNPDETSHVLLRKGFKSGEVMAYKVSNFENNAVLSGTLNHAYGPETITDNIGDLKFNISPRSFFQVNPIQVENLYGLAVDYAGLTGSKVCWDLYCGIGTITLSLAKRAAKVYGVEVLPEAIEDAKKNAALNGITNAKFCVGKAEEVIQRDDFEKPDVVVVDPPRKGCDNVCLDTIIKMSPERIVYVSCDSATLARDLKKLAGEGYKLEKATPVDMFPQTVHVECACLLTKEE